MPQTRVRMPSGFGPAGKQLWKSIADSHELGPDALRVLTDACNEADLVQRLERALRKAPLMVTGSQGQLVASPLVSEVRQHRSVLSNLLKALRLPVSGEQAKTTEEQISEQARAAARARWSKPKLEVV